jgi:MFS transporter, putative metabolite:H+ symporter
MDDNDSSESLLSESTSLFSVDQALELAGGWSTFQRRLMLRIGALQASCAAHMLAPIFLIPRLISDWSLSPSAAALLSSAYFAGYLVGVSLWAAVSDRRGRRPATCLAFTIGNLSGLASFLAPNYAFFVVLRFVCGFGIAGAKNGIFLLATEFAPPAARAHACAVISYAWLVGLLFLVGSAWLLQQAGWRWLALTYVPAVGIQLIMHRLPESPRFLLVAGDAVGARSTLLAVFRANRADAPQSFSLRRPPLAEQQRSTFMQLWLPAVRGQTSIIGFCQAVVTMVYYAITFDPSTNAAAGDLYLGALLSGLVELPSYMLLQPLTNSLGRKKSYASFLFLSAVCLLALHLSLHASSATAALVIANGSGGPAADAPAAGASRPQRANWAAMSAAMGGRFCAITAVSVAYIIAAELFPTTCRNSAVGWGTGCGRIGAILAPVLMLNAPNPLLLFVGLSLLSAALVCLLPESSGLSLADVPDDALREPGSNEPLSAADPSGFIRQAECNDKAV